MNQVIVIEPYRKGNMWVFDDATRGLTAEAFVMGASEAIDMMLKGKSVLDPEGGFILLFSKDPVPDYDAVIHLEETSKLGGSFYKWKEKNHKLWLCPALFLYFENAPKRIYVKVKQREGITKVEIAQKAEALLTGIIDSGEKREIATHLHAAIWHINTYIAKLEGKNHE